MIMQGIYINKDSRCIFLREKIKKFWLYTTDMGSFIENAGDEMPLPEKI